MKRLLTILLLSLSLATMGQTVAPIIFGDTAYYPQKTDAGQVIRPAAFSVVRSTGYDPSKKYAIWVNIHGIGEVSEGKLENLRNVTLGFDYDGDGPEPRKYAIATPDFLAARNIYNFLAVTPTYSGELTVDQIKYIFSQVEKDYSVDTSRRAIIGFSLGGKAVTRYMSSSPANAARIAVAVAVAPVNGVQSCKVVADAGLPFIGATNTTDDRVSPTNLQAVINCLRAQAPRIAPYHLVFKGSGHGGINEMLSLSHPEVPQNIYSFLQSVTNTDRKAYPTSATPKPADPAPPPTTLKALANFTGLGPVYGLDGRQSTGYKWARWTVVQAPSGVKLSTPMIQGAGNITAKFTAPQAGQYEIELQVNDDKTWSAPSKVTITYGAAPVLKTFAGFDSVTGLITWSDGSTEPGTARYTAGKWVVKDAAGREVAY